MKPSLQALRAAKEIVRRNTGDPLTGNRLDETDIACVIDRAFPTGSEGEADAPPGPAGSAQDEVYRPKFANGRPFADQSVKELWTAGYFNGARWKLCPFTEHNPWFIYTGYPKGYLSLLQLRRIR